jgi:hypothetical protein
MGTVVKELGREADPSPATMSRKYGSIKPFIHTLSWHGD